MTDITPRLLSIPQTATYLGRSVGAVQKLVERRAFRVVKSDRRVFVDRLDLDRWIEGGKE